MNFKLAWKSVWDRTGSGKDTLYIKGFTVHIMSYLSWQFLAQLCTITALDMIVQVFTLLVIAKRNDWHCGKPS